MHLKRLFSVVLLTLVHLFSLGQELTFGPVSGINFSNLQGEMIYQSWNAKPGTVNGLFVKATLGNWLSLKTGAEFTSFYYQEKWPYNSYYSGTDSYNYTSLLSSSFFYSSCIIGPMFPTYRNYNFLRVPLVLQWNTPGRLSFGFGAGGFYSFLMNDEFTGKDKQMHTEEYIKENFPPENDWGMLLTTSLSYAINNQWNIFLEGRTTYGKEVYLKDVDGKNGSYELLLGVGFSPFSKEENAQVSGSRIEIMPHAGITYSKSVAPDKKQDYAMLPALNSGISVKFKLDSTFSLISGAWYVQNGYRIDKASQTRLYYTLPHNEEQNISLQSDVSLEYITLPLLGELSFGGRFTTNIQFGLYYSILQNAQVNGEEIRRYDSGSGYQVQKEYFSQSVEGWFVNNDFGGLAGLRLEYRIFPKSKFYVSMNRAWGFTKLFDDNQDDSSGAAPTQLENFRNRSWTASLGLVIPLAQN